jgi:hypothetical protein
MEHTYNMHQEIRNAYKIFIGKPQRKILLARQLKVRE